MMKRNVFVSPLLVLLSASLLMHTLSMASAFTLHSPSKSFSSSTHHLILKMSSDETTSKTDVKKAAAAYVEPGRNPNNPLLPELKGDFDWDEKFGSDDDWIVTDVPGKRVVSEAELTAQVTALDALEQKWKKERQGVEYDKARLLGWTEQAETYNGRYAMFFLVVGLLTEYWTGFSMPAQVEEMLRIGGVIGFEG